MPKDDGIAVRLHEGSGLNHRYQWWGKHTRVLGFVLPVAWTVQAYAKVAAVISPEMHRPLLSLILR
jgi:hypothetical protein